MPAKRVDLNSKSKKMATISYREILLQIDYMETVGSHDSLLPNFVRNGILKENSGGEKEYDLGPDAHFWFNP